MLLLSSLYKFLLLILDIFIDGNIFLKLYIILVQWAKFRTLQRILDVLYLKFDGIIIINSVL